MLNKVSTKTILFLIVGMVMILIPIILELDRFLSIFIIYIGITVITFIVPDYKYINWLKIIIFLPMALLMLIGPLSKVFFIFTYGYLMPLGIIALFFKFIPIFFFDIDLSYSSNVYLTLTLTSLFVTLYSERIMKWSNKIINNDNPDELVDLYNNLSFHLINRNRTKYLIFLGFFLYIIIYSISSLNDFSIFDDSKINIAIMQSFATYIAFDRLLNSKALFDFKPKEFLSKMSKIWNFDFNPKIENEENKS